MKFRLRTLFAITAISGALLFLARKNALLPVLPLAMFGPATVVFFKRPTWILGTIVATLTVWLAGWVVLHEIEIDPSNAEAFRELLIVHGVHFDDIGFSFKIPWMHFRLRAATFGIDQYGGFWSTLYLQHALLMLLIIAYGLSLQLLAWWLKRRREAEQPA